MSIENPFKAPSSEQDEAEGERKAITAGGKAGRWLKKNVALAGAVGVGFFGNMQDNAVASPQKTEKDTGPKLEHLEDGARSFQEKTIGSTNMFEIVGMDSKATWGVEFVPKQDKDGKGFFAERYVKIDDASGATSVIGEYNDLFEAAEGISKIAGVPETVRKHAQLGASSVKTERDFQASGFTEPTGKVEGKTHIENREFEGYGIKANNKVEVDEKGNTVRLVDSEILEPGK